MSDSCRAVTGSHRLDAVLLAYLQEPGAALWPGADGLTTADALGGYLAAAAARKVPGRDELLRAHPEFCEEVTRFFAGEGVREPSAGA
jgi:hypothetical protein